MAPERHQKDPARLAPRIRRRLGCRAGKWRGGRFKNIAVWNSLMKENDDLVKRWTEVRLGRGLRGPARSCDRPTAL